MIVYSSLLLLALVVSAPWWLWRMLTSGRYRSGLSQRLGILPNSLDETITRRGAAPGLVWLHAVSVGEVLAIQHLVAELQSALPGHLLVVSTTTETGQQIARDKLNGVPVFYYPLDFRFAVGRYLRALRPTLFVTVESEFWPRMLVECDRVGIPVAVVNARISDRSFPRYLRLRKLWRPLLAKVSLFLAQGEETAERLRQIGVAPQYIEVSGNLKYDVAGGGENAMTRRIGSLLWQSRLIIAGSTAEGEERFLLDAWPSVLAAVPDAALMIAPRHPQRFDQVTSLVRDLNVPFFLCSQLLTATEPLFPGVILILDTIGDLAAIYAIASVAFVGGSLVSGGGQNPIEPSRFGVPVLIGPSFENFREVVASMLEHDALTIVSPTDLTSALISAMQSGGPSKLRFAGVTGATRRTVEALVALTSVPR